ncbi:choice-of-anchor H family protein [Colwellia sp.]|uniref:choice-of-anchor H family protein n=1 Tax=Colwellia sp. TaxID=56799 RepID=UPI0025BB81A8|nr:choice-of-anchor H family protein [Colwellia sp.]
MMNNFIKQLSCRVATRTTAKVISRETLKKTSRYLSAATAELSPIVSTSLQLSLMLTLMLMTLPSFAEQADDINISETKTAMQSYSIGQSANITNKASTEQMKQAIKQRILLSGSDQAQNKALVSTRNEIINQKHQQARKKNSARLFKKMAEIPIVNTSKSFSDGSFVIYEGYSQLIEDYDSDGYYQTFSVTFDADLITYNPYDEAAVYAELYLSENGGPWQHYYTTDSFVIHGESSDDSFEVYSTLAQGFNPNHYDVLIDLYEVGYPNIVASYSSDDSNSLYALPLESSDFDIEYIEYYEETHIYGGSGGMVSLLVLLTLMLRRLLGKLNRNFGISRANSQNTRPRY